MIRITEQVPYKQPGLSSFKVEFNYDQRIVDTIKQVPNALWHKTPKYWEIPVTSLSRAIQLLHNLDSIELILRDDTSNIEDNSCSETLNMNYKTDPFDYQLDGIKYGLTHDKWLLLDSPGLGKTLQMIYLAQELKERGEVNHCLVVCGVNALKHNWKREIEKHSDLSVKILGERVNKKGNIKVGGIKERLEDLKKEIPEFFTITNIETLRNVNIVKEINNGKNKFDMIIFDECHKAKSVGAQQTKGLRKLDSKYKVAMTGTLLTNNPLDAYVPLNWLGIDNSTASNYKNYYCVFGGPFGNELVGYKNTDVLKDQIARYSLRRTKDLLDLPPKTIIQEYVQMEDDQNDFYNNIVEGIVEQVDRVNIRPNNILSLVVRLRQATACPWVLTSEDIPSAKIDRAVELTEEIVGGEDKVIIFSVFKDPLYKLKDLLKDYNPVMLTGDNSDNEVEEAKNIFQNNDSCKVMLATTQKAGTGLTLTAASYAIFIDTPWTAAEFEQAQDRIHRIGATKNVTIYELITEGTIDERVHEIVKTKEAISDFIIDDKITNESYNALKDFILDL